MTPVIAALGLDAEQLIKSFGLAGIFAIVFAESGLLVGFFLPGDAMLFTAGFFASGPDAVASSLHFPLAVLIPGIAISAIAGDQVGYVFGRRVGPALFRRPDSRVFKQEYVHKAAAYFERYGPRTIILARYIPIVRTFAPIVAGVSKMEYRKFLIYNIVGGIAWAVVVPLLGYFLGQIDAVANNIEVAILVVVLVSCSPVVFEVVQGRRRRRAATG